MFETTLITCPYCGESLELAIDPSISEQEYIEDCQVCCSPIRLRVTLADDGGVRATAERENN